MRGPNFLSYHKLFDTVFDNLMKDIDTVGERTAALGGIARATVQSVTPETPLMAYPVLATGEHEHLEQLASCLGALSREFSTAISVVTSSGDHVSADVLTDAAATTEILLWTIESHKPLS